MVAEVDSPSRPRLMSRQQMSHTENTIHEDTSICDSTANMTTVHLASRTASQRNRLPDYSLSAPRSAGSHSSGISTENVSPQKPAAGHSHDRFIPRATFTSSHHGELAKACGVASSRILEFSNAPPLQRKFAAADFISQYTQHLPQPRAQVSVKRHIPTKPVKILDAPGIVDDFYASVIDWSAALNCMAIGLGSTVYCWDPKTSGVSVIAELDADGLSGVTVTSVSWSNEDTCICIATSTGDVQIWDAGTGSLIRSMRGRNCGRVAALSWNEPLVSSGGRDGSIWNHDVRIKRHKVSELRAHSGEVCGLTWRQDGRLLASGGNDNLVNLWDARVTSVPKHQLTMHQAAVKALAWCPWHANLLATGGGSADQQIHFWNATSGHCANSINAEAQVTSLHWSQEHREIVATLGYPSNAVAVWSHSDLTKQAQITNAHDARILGAALSNDGQTLVTCAADENIKFWDLFEGSQTKKRQREFQGFRSGLALGRV